MSNDLVPMDALERMAAAIAKSGLFGLKTPEQAIALMLVAQAEGLHPATAAMEYDIIQGRPARKSSAMLSRFQASGGKMRYTERTDARVAAVFSHPQGGEIEIDWTMERAKKAGLGGKDNWHKWPRQMLSARVISEGVRAVFPGATGMFYEPGEVADMEPLKDVTPPAPAKKPRGGLASPGILPTNIIPHDPETGEIDPDFPAHELDAPEQRELIEPEDAAKARAVAEANRDHVFKRLDSMLTAEGVDHYLKKHKATLEGFPADIRDAIYNRATDRIEALSASGA